MSTSLILIVLLMHTRVTQLWRLMMVAFIVKAVRMWESLILQFSFDQLTSNLNKIGANIYQYLYLPNFIFDSIVCVLLLILLLISIWNWFLLKVYWFISFLINFYTKWPFLAFECKWLLYYNSYYERTLHKSWQTGPKGSLSFSTDSSIFIPFFKGLVF